MIRLTQLAAKEGWSGTHMKVNERQSVQKERVRRIISSCEDGELVLFQYGHEWRASGATKLNR